MCVHIYIYIYIYSCIYIYIYIIICVYRKKDQLLSRCWHILTLGSHASHPVVCSSAFLVDWPCQRLWSGAWDHCDHSPTFVNGNIRF